VTATIVTAAMPGASRKLSGDPIGPASLAVPRVLDDGHLAFVAPPGAYGPIPTWHSRQVWLGAIKLHPRLGEACRRRVRVPLFLQIMREFAWYADPGTGRGINVSHERIAQTLGICTKTVQRAVNIGASLGVLHRVLAGCDMSLNQRGAVLDRYAKGLPERRWRSLPNSYAASLPASLARVTARATRPQAGDVRPGVDNSLRCKIIVHLPEGVYPASKTNVSLYQKPSFSPACGHSSAPSATSYTPAATRPTQPQRQRRQTRAGPTLSPELEAYAAALRRRLTGFGALSLRRIAPALQRYRQAGLSPGELQAGLDTYLSAHRLTWIHHWQPRHQAEQARYLIGMLTRARQAGYLIPAPWKDWKDDPGDPGP
jgi:hypothetical protein